MAVHYGDAKRSNAVRSAFKLHWVVVNLIQSTIRVQYSPSPADRAHLVQNGLSHLSIRIDLEDVVLFDTPLNRQPLVNQLGFITNKTYRGYNFGVPATIGDEDFAVLITSATTLQLATT